MNLNLSNPDTWEAIALQIHTDIDYHYDTSDMSHCIDLAQIVCQALLYLGRQP